MKPSLSSIAFTQTLQAALLLTIAGCGGADRPPLGTVTGKVTLDSEPLSGAQVNFTPTAGGRTSYGETAADGTYSLEYTFDAQGAVVGPHTVRITTVVEPKLDDKGKVEVAGVKERLPAKYHENTELTREVKPGSNQIDFELTSQ